MSLPILVMKFGGTSVEDSEAFERVAGIVGAQKHARRVVVVSAMKGVTDALVSSFGMATKGFPNLAAESLDHVYQRHLDVADSILSIDDYRQYRATLELAACEIDELLHLVGEAPEQSDPSLQDGVVSYGEQLSSALLTRVLVAQELPARLVDARRCVITDDSHGCGVPLIAETNRRTQRALKPVLDAGEIPVLGGFIGSTKKGVTTTLGRNGSDYSAALIGAALDSAEIQIWTDVNGVLTADPHLVSEPRPIPLLSYEEATELARLGSRVIYPQAVQPAETRQIPLRICNSRAPHEEGTLISTTTSISAGIIKSIAYQPGLETDQGCAMISLIGEGLHADEGIAARALEALGDMSIFPAVRNGSASSLSFVIEEERSVVAVKRLHQVFFEEAEDDFTTVLSLEDVFSESERLRHEGRVVVEIAARHEASGPELERFAWELRESISLID